jgi:MFS family permease
MTLQAYRRIFALSDFRRFWIGFSISALGDSLSRVALTWYVYELTRSPAALGLLMICFTGPIIIGGLIAGWLLDRFDRRMVLLIDSVLRGVAMAVIPLLHLSGMLLLWHIYLVAAIYGLLMMIGLAGGPTIVPSLVPAEQLATANALEMLSWTLAGVVGPVLAGFLITLLGAPAVVGLDALSYAIFALLLLRLSPLPTPISSSSGGYGLTHAFHILISKPVLSSTTVMFLVFNIGGGMLAVALPIMADGLAGGGSQMYGLLLGAQAIGEVISALLVGGLVLALPLGTRICLAQLCSGVALLLLLIPAPPAVALLALLLFGLCSAPLTIWAQTLRMEIIPAALRGRTFALLRMLMQSGNPLGGALGGTILPALGLPALLLLSAALVGLPGLSGVFVTPLRQAGTANLSHAVPLADD